jgi:YHS domain-containing protein
MMTVSRTAKAACAVLAAVGLWIAPGVANAEEHTTSTAASTSAEAKSDYPIDTCVVSGEKLGEHGKVVKLEHEGREVAFCCQSCVKDFKADPAKYLKKLDDAIIAKEKPAYPLDTCVVSGEKLQSMGGGTDFIYKNHLVRFCCAGCEKTFLKDPAKYLGMIQNAAKAKVN